MIYLMYKSAKFGLVLTVTFLQIYIYGKKEQNLVYENMNNNEKEKMKYKI